MGGPLVAAPGYASPDLAEPPVYSYTYGVNDDYSGANFQQTESRDGYATSGSYTVALPDGRTQDVTYEGVPQYGPAVVKTAVVAPQLPMLLLTQLLLPTLLPMLLLTQLLLLIQLPMLLLTQLLWLTQLPMLLPIQLLLLTQLLMLLLQSSM